MEENKKDKFDRVITIMIKWALVILMIISSLVDCRSLISSIVGFIDWGELIFVFYSVLYFVAFITHLALSIYFSIILFKKKK